MAVNVHMAGKLGDLVYALPAMRALARIHTSKVHLITSPLCWQIVPLLWEQPYIEDVEVDATRPYRLTNGITNHWDYFADGEGYNLSSQPKMFEMGAPLSWTNCYASLAGVQLEQADLVVFPTLVNHRLWMRSATIYLDGQAVGRDKYVVIAPEVETLETTPIDVWDKITNELSDKGFRVIKVGLHSGDGLFSIPTLARLIADADAFVGAHSFPWHLARHIGTPAVCLQKWQPGLARSLPVDTSCYWYQPEDWHKASDRLLTLIGET